MLILPENGYLQYSGRIDFDDKNAPVFVFPASYVKMNFTGKTLKVVVENHRDCWNNYLGYILDGEQGKLLLPVEGKATIGIPVDQDKDVHELLLFKRQDSCHTFTFYGFEVDDDCVLEKVEEKPERRIEVFGDSVSAGEVSEAVDYVGQPDPEHNGEYSNSWYSYSWMTARKLGAELHDIAQGGIALLDGTGYFAPPGYMGMEHAYDCIEYSPRLGKQKKWDFSQYIPHVVIIAIGQNDNHPEDYMHEDPTGEKAAVWKEHYEAFVRKIREIYPKSVIILKTTILEHSVEWDEAIEEICRKLQDKNLYHFLYSNNGSGTKGHIRIPEADRMSDELCEFIRSLGDEIWLTEP
ncbi:MAG: GDSL-type esterase/lipase family protein [Lachnospiraceae bacterium]|nr:GDSL-type esterase/lipase family protein [Lachnospiraceae bacterium]